jgi:hypothetical protein
VVLGGGGHPVETVLLVTPDPLFDFVHHGGRGRRKGKRSERSSTEESELAGRGLLCFALLPWLS